MVKKYYQKNKYVSFFNIVEDNGTLWVANSCFNGLFKMKEDGTGIEYVVPLEDSTVEMPGMSLYFEVVVYKRQILFLPHSTFKIAVFDLDTRTVSHINISSSSDVGGYMTAGYAIYGGYLYLFSYYAKYNAVRIHLETFEVEKLSVWDQIIKNYYNEDIKYILAEAVQIGDNIWIGIKETNKILRYSLQSGLYEELECANEVVKLFGNQSLQELYVISSDGHYIECIDSKNWENRKYIDLSAWIEMDSRILYLLSDEKAVVVIPIYGKYIIEINRENGNITKYQNFPEEFENFNENNRFFYTGRLKEEYIELFPYFTNGLIRIDRKSGEIKFYSTEIKCEKPIEELVLEFQYHSNVHNSVCFEAVYSLNSFIGVLTGEGNGEEKIRLAGATGRTIAQYIMHEKVIK
ncbi:MAG: hypothetical protein NC118_04410 [Eubacterium sp.]|nr:hypothetical protein [Eubacterium sp.]